MADIFSQSLCLKFGIALMAQRSATALDESQVGQLNVAMLAAETTRMPVLVHSLDHPPNDEFSTFSTARSKKYLKIMFTILPALKLKECSVFEYLEALCTTEIDKIY